ncbi:hypothetical protein NCZ17_02115 [Acinetobacter modestus]|uniref:major capsid protein n=1 Tax=Acinetobacter modestus TaxID=1776740 RepID=UPI00202EE0F7|nr:hypothetical protein [Acinetobacter modestus]MCM1958167.1 hypothetical protein [Acinetobacter modestus]
MSLVAQLQPTLMDLAARYGQTPESAVIEILTASNEMLDDMVWVEANDGTGHKTTVRTGLPRGAWRLLNYGVPSEKSATAAVRDTCGLLESYSEVDKQLYDMEQNPQEWRASEDSAFVEGMSQTMGETVLYGNSRDTPAAFTGFAPRYNDIAQTNPANKRNILDAGGTGNNNTSIWFVVWHKDTVHGIYPKGTKGGLQITDLGEATDKDANGLMHQVLRTHFVWNAGVTVRDWRAVVRIANIDVTALTKDASAGADLFDLLAQAAELLPRKTSGRIAIYANRTISQFLRRQSVGNKNVRITTEEQGGRSVTKFDGIPIRRVDALLNTESRVV